MKKPTLHEEIANILTENDNKGLTASEIAAQVNKRKRYKKKNGTDVKSNQISARTSNHSEIFEKREGLIFLIQQGNPVNKTHKNLKITIDIQITVEEDLPEGHS